MLVARRRHPASRPGRIAVSVNLGLFMLGLLATVWSLAYLAHRPLVRMQFDATRTRAYSLSEQSRAMLSRLEGQWYIAMVCVRGEIDPAAFRQVEEVLDRYAAAAPLLRIEHIDPTDPNNVALYDDLIRRLRTIYSEQIDAYEHHIEAGLDGYEALLSFAQREGPAIAQLIQPIHTSEPLYAQLDGARSAFALLAESGSAIATEIRRTMEVSQVRPIPDYEFARDALHAATSRVAADLKKLSRDFETAMTARTGLSAEVRAYFADRRVRLAGLATDLQRHADALMHLEPLELARIGRELERGEALIICGPDGASVIAANQILPRSNLRATQQGGIAFDQRFRGEQVISSAIRAMVYEHMPLIVFVHSQSDSPLTPRSNGQDVAALARALTMARYEVAEWSLIGGAQPAGEAGQPVVWVILPPPFADRAARMSFDTMREERLLIEAASDLMRDGQPVLLPYYPSLLHRFQQPDPWQELGRALGVEVDTARLLTQRLTDAQGAARLQQTLDLIESPAGHAIAAAVYGQPLHLSMPVVMETLDAAPRGTTFHTILAAAPSNEVFLDPEWTRSGADREIDDAWRLEADAALAIGVERPSPRGGGAIQRVLIIGSVDWMHTPVIEAGYRLDEQRVVPVYPGNLELMQAAAAWLAGMDELIARSPAAQQIARIDGLSTEARNRWRWAIIAGLPIICLVFGAAVWLVRR